MDRREYLAAVTGCISLAAGCMGGGNKDSDGDGVNDANDYAPNDPTVRSRADVQSSSGGNQQQSQSTPSPTPAQTPTRSPTPEPEQGASHLDLEPCDGEDKFIRIEFIDREPGTEVVLHNTLYSAIMVHHFEVQYTDGEEYVFPGKDFQIPGKGVESIHIQGEVSDLRSLKGVIVDTRVEIWTDKPTPIDDAQCA